VACYVTAGRSMIIESSLRRAAIGLGLRACETGYQPSMHIIDAAE
jgi:hypothetical protein